MALSGAFGTKIDTGTTTATSRTKKTIEHTKAQFLLPDNCRFLSKDLDLRVPGLKSVLTDSPDNKDGFL